ncbi:hypothetical protein BDF19DRAFT_419136 [Syncephalis fuscata]|nr:hypothetical protein BDF19DRAFT_419136 [Syncephalis fuscata]
MKFSTVVAAIATLAIAAQSADAMDPNKILCLVNEVRARNGKPALRLNVGLNLGAAAYSNVMSTILQIGQRPSHNFGPVGFQQRLDSILAPLGLKLGSENTYNGKDTEKEVVDGWIASPTHYQNILSDATDMGVALATRGSQKFWTQIFGTDGKQHSYPVCPGASPTPAPVPASLPPQVPAPQASAPPAPTPVTYTPAPPAPAPVTYTPTAPSTPAPAPRKCHKKVHHCNEGESKCDNGQISHCRRGRWEVAFCPASHYCKVDSPIKACCAKVPGY